MSKRAASQTRDRNGALKQGDRPMEVEEDEVGPYEDEHEDEFEDEIVEIGADGEIVEEEGLEAIEDDVDRMQVDEDGAKKQNQTFIPGRNKLSPGEVLEPDESAYDMLHRLEPTWPCLSFDIIRDHLGEGRARKKYPATVYSVAGTQAARGHEKENEILVMKMSKLSRTNNPDQELSEEEDSDDDDDENTDPILETKSIRLNTSTNRIRAHQSNATVDINSPFPKTLTATMTESGAVHIHDITPHLTSFDTPGTTITPAQNQPLHTIKAHKSTEGYAIDWSPHSPQRKLLTGDTSGRIFLTTQDASGTWTTDASRPFTGHTSSVEELQWSPSEPSVFASASADSTVRIWDTRSKTRKPALSVTVSTTDVNVLSWSRQTDHLLASGADDGTWAVWDLRSWKPSPSSTSGNNSSNSAAGNQTAVASFSFHKEQITSVEWHPTDSSVVAVAAGDNTISLWDVAVELDDEESQYTADVKDVPPQLLFLHYMDEVKEAHWHPQISGALMATGGSGFGVFKTISV